MEFGLDGRNPPNLFTSKTELTTATPQAHLLRRAFDDLKVDGILCVDHAPLAYFMLVKQITPEAIVKLHRQFWSLGGAALLVLVTDARVHIYSGMVPPSLGTRPGGAPPIEIECLDRVADALRAFTVSVESGEYFGNHDLSFDPQGRVDRHLLDNLMRTRIALADAAAPAIPDQTRDALLCRLVFTCYLFDREVIGADYLTDLGIDWASDPRGLLGHPNATEAIGGLYRLFDKLKQDFNGDLFDSDLAAEKRLVRDVHLKTLYTFFAGMTVGGVQGTLFPLYDFAYIPIETISAIYERFLKDEEQEDNKAFYTPRFLAELVLDTATADLPSLLGKRFLDPACGSGIFLVGLFHRMAEEWRRANPKANNDRRAKALMRLLQESLFGVDVSLTACRITAFSLYLAYLDQLTPPDIRNLQQKGRALPRLVAARGANWEGSEAANIREGDFFSDDESIPKGMSLVVGNPPWGGTAGAHTPAGAWCKKHDRPLPDKQIAAAFAWKAAEHAEVGGAVCLILPHGILFNHSTTAVAFQAAWVRAYAMDRVINLADLRFILFEKAIHPAVVVKYRNTPPSGIGHPIDYWSPKADWTVSRAEIVTIGPQDRVTLKLGELLADLAGPDAPRIWKRHYWATPRDWRLIDRLGTYPRLRDITNQKGETSKRWRIATGLRYLTPNDLPHRRVDYELPTSNFIGTSSEAIDLGLDKSECEILSTRSVVLRRNLQYPEIFMGPHVLFNKGFTKAAYADFDVAFLEAVRGIHGPEKDKNLLMLVAAFLRSALGRYFLFHTSNNWGIYRPELHVEEVLRVPFPLPDDLPDPARGREIVAKVAKIVTSVARAIAAQPFGRKVQIEQASLAIEPLVNEYFDITPAEAALIEDTTRVIIPSIQPAEISPRVRTVYPAERDQCDAYQDRVCQMLNGWAKSGQSGVRGYVEADQKLGVGVAVFEKVDRARMGEPMARISGGLPRTLDAIRTAIPRSSATLDIVRGVMVFDGPRLYVVKPIGQRYWTQTAAMNDADEIAGTILMRSPKGGI